jgi:hypothetical protein
LVAAGILMLLAGAIFGFLDQWLYAVLIWAGALGCLAAVPNSRKQKTNRGDRKMKNELLEITPFLDINGRLIAILTKYKKKLIALWYLAGKFDAGKKYSEAEINGLLDEWTLFHDPATLHWELFNTHLLNRTADW